MVANEEKLMLLKKHFGHDGFRKGQQELVDCALSGRDCVGIMPTGAGKSVCYQLPAIMADGITLVVTPLISLMKDQVDTLRQNGISGAFFNSSLTMTQMKLALQNARQGKYKLIYVAPERLDLDSFVEFARDSKVSMICVDEAHCVSQWGQDFRPSYLNIAQFIAKLPYRPVICAYTATATEFVREDIKKLLKLQNPFEIVTGFDRKNLYYEVKKPKDKFGAVLDYLSDSANAGKSGVIYCSTRDNVESVCQQLIDAKYNATRYHAGLSDNEKIRNQQDFSNDTKPIMVATNAFGMGIDKSNVSFVIHYNMPKNIESYYQEAGRAGRDGSNADCILLFSGKDIATNQFFIEHASDNNNLSKQEQEQVKQKDRERLRMMTNYCQTTDCLREYVLKYFKDNSDVTCGNCSNCLTTFDTVDITVQAQKVLSCISRMGEKYGILLLVDTLKGSINDKIKNFGLDKIKTYGAMSDMSTKKIREIVDFLIIREYIELTNTEYPTTKLTDKAADILFDGQKIQMKISNTVDVDDSDDDKKRSSNTRRNKKASQEVDNQELFEVLKKCRADIATQQKVKPYMVFSNATLIDMCQKMPKNDSEFLNVSGVGQFKYEKYGERFLHAIGDFLYNQK